MDKEIILSIQEKEFILPECCGSSMSGFIIKTNKQEIKLGIQNFQDCCEDWGYFMYKDDVSEFIGATILNITLTDKCLRNTKDFNKLDFYGGLMFVNIETNKGTLQFTAYNKHEGCYGHDACVISRQLIAIEEI